MSSTIASLIIRVAADVSELKTNMAKASEEVETAFHKIESVTKLLGVAFGAGELIAGIKEFVVSSVEAFAEAEAGAMRLDVALRNTGLALPEVREGYHALAAQLAQVTTQSDSALISAETLFATMGKVGPAQMRAALTAATDLAVFYNGDLNAAVETIISATEGQTKGLKKLGIELDTTAIAGDKLPVVLQKIEEHMGGQAQAQMDTYAGKMAHLRNEWGRLQESIGKLAVAGESSTGFISGWSTIIGGIATSIDKFGLMSTAAQLARGDLLGVVDAGTLLAQESVKAADALANIAPPATIAPIAAYQQHLEDLKAAVQALTPAEQAAAKAGHELGESNQQIAEGLHLSERAVNAFFDALAGQERFRKATAEWKQLMDQLHTTTVIQIGKMVKEVNEKARTMGDAIIEAQLKVRQLLIEQRKAMGMDVSDLAPGLVRPSGDANLDKLNEEFKAKKDELDNLALIINDPNTLARINEMRNNMVIQYDNAFTDIVQKASGLGPTVAAELGKGAPAIAAASAEAAGSVQNNFLAVFGNVESRAGQMVDTVTGTLHAMQMTEAYQAAGFFIQQGPADMLNFQRAKGRTTAGMPHLAGGGIVNAPTVALIGEKGPEAVIPLDRAGGSVGGHTFNLTLNVMGGGKAAADELIAYLRARGVRL